jgi:hypothetical protein
MSRKVDFDVYAVGDDRRDAGAARAVLEGDDTGLREALEGPRKARFPSARSGRQVRAAMRADDD